MKQDIVAIVARQLKEAQYTHAQALRVVERIQTLLNRKTVLLQQAEIYLHNIEEIHNAITQD